MFTCVLSLPQWRCYRTFQPHVWHPNVHAGCGRTWRAFPKRFGLRWISPLCTYWGQGCWHNASLVIIGPKRVGQYLLSSATHLLYSKMSGTHTRSASIVMRSIPPNSEAFHWNIGLNHFCKVWSRRRGVRNLLARFLLHMLSWQFDSFISRHLSWLLQNPSTLPGSSNITMNFDGRNKAVTLTCRTQPYSEMNWFLAS